MKTLYKEKTKWKDEEFLCEYIDGQDFSKLSPVTQVQALCVNHEGNFIIYEDCNQQYGLPGGTVEKGETLDECLYRELREEASVKPIHYGPLLYLKVTNLSRSSLKVDYHVRYWALVDLIDEPVKDPDGKAIRRHIVTLTELPHFLKWGKKVEIYLDKLKTLQAKGIAKTKVKFTI